MISGALTTQDLNSPGSAADVARSAPLAVKRSKKEIRPLTSLRFFAAFAVVVSHASESFSCWHGLSKCYVVAQAVTFFFVLSGFILTYNYFNLNGLKETLRFYLARVARIWPAHLATLVLLLLLLPEVFKLKSGDAPLFLCNLSLLQSWVPSWHVFFSYNASSWSISTELFFYLCFPLLLFVLRKNWMLPLSITGIVVAVLIGICKSWHLPEFDASGLSSQGLLYISPLSSIFDFAAGMTAAYIWREYLSQKNLNIVLATTLEILLVVAVCLLNVNSEALRYFLAPALGDAAAYWMQNSGPAVIGFGALITLFAMERGYISRLLSQPFLVLLGELSFGIYMLHGVLITYLGVNFPLAQSTAACCSFVLALCVAAHIMFECVEKPMRSWILSKSSCLLGTKSNTAPPRALNKPEQAQKWLGKRQLFLLAELLAFAAFVYFSLPTVNLVAASDAAQVAQESTVPNIILSPYIECIGAKAQLKGEQVSLSLVWKCLKDQSLNYTVNAVLLDGQGKRLGSLSYMQDGRRQFVKAGKCWIEHPVLKQGSAGIPSAISITVLRNKHEALHTSAGQNESCSFSVPVQSY